MSWNHLLKSVKRCRKFWASSLERCPELSFQVTIKIFQPVKDCQRLGIVLDAISFIDDLNEEVA